MVPRTIESLGTVFAIGVLELRVPEDQRHGLVVREVLRTVPLAALQLAYLLVVATGVLRVAIGVSLRVALCVSVAHALRSL